MEISATKGFLKAYRRLTPRQQRRVDEALVLYQDDRMNMELRDHALKGKKSGLRTFSAGWDLRVIYREEGGFITIILIDAGTHNQVF